MVSFFFILFLSVSKGISLFSSCPNYLAIDVVVMTGYSKDYSYMDVIKAGATDFIAKPFMKDEFTAKLDRIFRERRLLKELRGAKEKAEAGSKAKTAFLCTISHELRNPMNGILGFTGMLGDADLSPDERGYLEIVTQSAGRLLKLINQILDFSAIEAGTSNIEPCHFYLNKVFEELVVSARTKAEDKGLALVLAVDDSLVKTLLFGDQLLLAQILHNLLDNAIKFSDSGIIEITVKKVRDISGDIVELQFSIKDMGCGIEQVKQSIIFEPFTQAEDYLTRKHNGAGLGLAICAKMVSMMNGKIWVESEVDQGATFYFTAQMNGVS